MQNVVSTYRQADMSVYLHRAPSGWGLSIYRNGASELVYWNRGMDEEQARADYEQLRASKLASILNPPVE